MERISEKFAIESLPLDITSATTSFAPAVSLKGAQSVAFVVSMGPAGAGQGVAIAAQQGASVAVAESSDAAAITGATAELGSTVANTVYKASAVRITLTTALTTETLAINGTTLTGTLSTAPSATDYTFGNSTLTNTAATGLALTAHNLASCINILFPKLTATTGAAYVDVTVKPEESTSISLVSTGGAMLVPSYLRAQTIVEIMVPGLNSSSLYAGCVVSSASTAIAGNILSIKIADKLPAQAHGVIVNDKNT